MKKWHNDKYYGLIDDEGRLHLSNESQAKLAKENLERIAQYEKSHDRQENSVNRRH